MCYVKFWYTAPTMEKLVVIEKKVGETPLVALDSWKSEHPEYAHTVACYAGRLDPMASGKLLVLFGDECKKQKLYTGLDKEYEIEVLLGVESDTGDVLGMPDFSKDVHVDERSIADVLSKELGAHSRAYPAFSSKTVNGKPLFLHTLEGTLSSIKMPTHVEHVYRIQHKDTYAISGTDLEVRVSEFLSHVPRTSEPSKKLGEDFRVDAIRARWESLFKTAQGRTFTVLRLKVICASGTYMRSLAGRIGESLGTHALALSIHRSKIGKYVPVWRGLGLWRRKY